MIASCTALSVANFMWQTQGILHWKNNPIVPVCLLTIAVSMVVYCHMTQDSELAYQSDPLKTFLCMILVQMIPLLALEVKIMSCADPVGLFCKFSVPVTLMHAIFLAMRFVHSGSYDFLYMVCSGLGLVAAMLTMLKGFHWSPRTIFHHKSVWGLSALSLLGAFFSHWLEYFLAVGLQAGPGLGLFHYLWYILAWNGGSPQYSSPHTWEGILETSNSYMEILAFVPAVWMVFSERKGTERVQIEEIDTKRTSTTFFLFLVGFYLSEDLLNAYEAWAISELATVAHVVHFLLLLDFACFILAHIYNPEKLMGDLRKWLPIDLSYDV
jgi:hypothetical protein